MAQTKVSALTALTATDGNEELLINDGGTSKKVTIDNVLHDNSIRAEHYVDGSIATAHLAADAITGAKIADDAIDSEHYVDGSIDNAHLADDAVGVAELSATGTASSTTFLRGDNSWVTPTDTNTTYSAGTGITLAGTTFSADPVALTTVQTAANQSAHLALTAQEGDVVVRSDENKTYMHNGGSAGSMSDYTLMATPTDAVTSVAGNTGVVTNAHIAAAVEAASDSNTFTDADHSKLNAIEASADVTDTTNVTAAGALMDSELASIAAVKATTGTFLSADESKLDGIAANANNYVHPNHSGEVTSSADGATVVADNVIDEANLKVSNAPTNGYILVAQSGNTGGLTWTAPASTALGNDSVDSANYVDGSIDREHLAADIVDGTKIADDSINSEHYVDGSIDTAHIGDDQVTAAKLANSINTEIAANTAKVTNATHTGDVTGSTVLTIANDAVDIAMLSATGTASSSTFLRGDNTWVTPTDTNTTYSVGDGGLTEINFTSADNTKLDGIEASATADQTAAQIKTHLENGIDSVHYVDGSIDRVHLAADIIDGTKIADNAINSEHYADGSIDAAHYAAGSVGTTAMADNAVTLDKMASGTDGNIISYDASGNPVAVATGTDGQVLTSTGAGSPPVFETPSGGGTECVFYSVKTDASTYYSTNVWTQFVTPAAGEEIDSNSAFASSTFTVPAGKAGTYWFWFNVSLGSISANAYYYFSLYKNGTGNNPYIVQNSVATGSYPTVSGGRIIVLAAGDTIKLYFKHTDGGSRYFGGGESSWGGWKISDDT